MTIRVLIADDEAMVLGGLSMLLGAEPDIEVVGEVSDGQAAVREVARLRPDVAVLDVRMPVIDGVEATRLIVGSHNKTTLPSILMLTTYDVDASLYGALRAGAAGFLLKNSAPSELARAVRAVHHGDGWLDPAVTRRVIEQFAERPLNVTRDDPRLRRLTPRETDVLRLLAQGLTNAEVAQALNLTEGTVKSHVQHLLSKLELRDRTQAVILAFTARLVD